MIIAVASGKGGTGKTTVTASLASVWSRPFVAVDLDVEEPNLHLFLKPDIAERTPVPIEVPVPDEIKCTQCKACVDVCQFKAVAVMGKVLMVFPEMCHGCGGCMAVCPEEALLPGERILGEMDRGTALGAPFLMGRLRVGEAMSPPLMRVVKERLNTMLAESDSLEDALMDAPPGVSCPAMCAVMDADFILLVTEPTPFGFHDFKLAHEAFAPMGKPMGAVVNRAGVGDESVQEYCTAQGLPVLAEIPYDRRIAEAYSGGKLAVEAGPEFRAVFESLRDAVMDLAKGGRHA